MQCIGPGVCKHASGRDHKEDLRPLSVEGWVNPDPCICLDIVYKHIECVFYGMRLKTKMVARFPASCYGTGNPVYV